MFVAKWYLSCFDVNGGFAQELGSVILHFYFERRLNPKTKTKVPILDRALCLFTVQCLTAGCQSSRSASLSILHDLV